MDRKTLTALKKSIKHWEENVEKSKKEILNYNDIDGTNCELCCVFGNTFCVGCPVYKKTFLTHCNGSPWRSVNISISAGKNTIEPCEKELAFLKSLLPVTPKTKKSK